MWKVRKGDHTLYVLGTIGIVPKGMEWTSREVRGVLEEAQEVIDGHGAKVDADVGFFGTTIVGPVAAVTPKTP